MYLKIIKYHVVLYDSLLNNVKSLLGYVDDDYIQDLDKKKITIMNMFTFDGGSIS